VLSRPAKPPESAPVAMTSPSECQAPRIVFAGSGEFAKTVRARVDAHFGDQARRSHPRHMSKAFFIACWFVASYVLLLTVESTWAQILLCFSFALAASAVGFNIFHEAIHGSLSSSARVNLAVSWMSCMVLGVGRYFWWYKHNIIHHRFTNIFEWDDDIETRGHLRLSPQQPWEAKFKNQHRFFVVLYCFHTLEWLFAKDFVQYFTLRLNPYQPIPPMSRHQKLEFWACKAFYVAVFVALPFALLPVWKVLIGMLIFHVTLSLVLAFVFNLAHAVEMAEFPVPTQNSATIEEEWAAHQMRTTVNFATDNPLLNWFTGGLNSQIEHHLFPLVSHAHYGAISGIVRKTAAEFGLPYNLYESYFGIVRSHFRLVRRLGVEPVTCHERLAAQPLPV
jgi:linoleoyl-CoA desaturase